MPSPDCPACLSLSLLPHAPSLQVGGLASFQWEVESEEEACGLCYTSGTTGPPKASLRRRRGCTPAQSSSRAAGRAREALAGAPGRRACVAGPARCRAKRLPLALFWHTCTLQGVLYSHRSNYLHAMVVALPDALDMRSSTAILAVVPLFHANRCSLFGATVGLPAPRRLCFFACSSVCVLNTRPAAR